MGPPQEALLLMLRQARPGSAKTRLIPALGPEGAARLSARLAARALATAQETAHPGRRVVACIAAAGGPEIIGHAEAERWEQPEGDLGRRMAALSARAFREGAHRVVLIGCDCPDLDAGLIDDAFALLSIEDAVLGPAIDGGYYLLGLARDTPEVFEGIDWGGERVAEQTLLQLERLGARVSLLPPHRDIDRPEDLEYMRSRWPELDED